MQLFLADGCKEALLEEKRRFCFLVDKHCMLSYQIATFHDKVQTHQVEHFVCHWLNCLHAVPWSCGDDKLIHRKASTISDVFITPDRSDSTTTVLGFLMHCVAIVMKIFVMQPFFWLLKFSLNIFSCLRLLDRQKTFWRQSWAAGRTSAMMLPTCRKVSWPWSKDCAHPSQSHLCPPPPRQGTVW